MYWYQRKQQKYINTPEGNIEVSTGRKMSFSYCYTSKDHSSDQFGTTGAV